MLQKCKQMCAPHSPYPLTQPEAEHSLVLTGSHLGIGKVGLCIQDESERKEKACQAYL